MHTKLTDLSRAKPRNEDEGISKIVNTRLISDNENIIAQYNSVSIINEQKLKSARNVKELIAIQITKIPQSQKEDGRLDLKFDPLTFRQQIPFLGDKNFLVNQAVLENAAVSTKKYAKIQKQTIMKQKSQSRSRSVSPQNIKYTKESEASQLEQIIKRGSQVETVNALQRLFHKDKVSSRRPLTNHIMERYAKKQRNSYSNLRSQREGAGIELQEKNLQQTSFKISSQDDLASDQLASGTPRLSLLEHQEKIRERLSNLKQLFDEEEAMQRRVQKAYQEEVVAPQNEQIVKNSANSSQDNDVAAIKDLKKIKTEVTQKGAELVRTKFQNQSKEGLFQFMKKRIDMLKDTRNPIQKQQSDELNYKYKVSTLKNILPNQTAPTKKRGRNELDLDLQRQEKRIMKERQRLEKEVTMLIENEKRQLQRDRSQQYHSNLTVGEGGRRLNYYASFMMSFDNRTSFEKRTKSPNTCRNITNQTENEKEIKSEDDLDKIDQAEELKSYFECEGEEGEAEIVGETAISDPTCNTHSKQKSMLTDDRSKVNSVVLQLIQNSDTSTFFAPTSEKHSSDLNNVTSLRTNLNSDLTKICNEDLSTNQNQAKLRQSKSAASVNENQPQQSVPKPLEISQSGLIKQSFLQNACFSYFSPKRFNRFPRFAQYIRGSRQARAHLDEKTISLNSEIFSMISEPGKQQENQSQSSKANQVTDYDPFDKVILFNGIDNQILTSFRTLKGDNNQVSNTNKVIHKRFMGTRNPQSRFYKTHISALANKMYFHQIDEISDSIEMEYDQQQILLEEENEKPVEQQTRIIQSVSKDEVKQDNDGDGLDTDRSSVVNKTSKKLGTETDHQEKLEVDPQIDFAVIRKSEFSEFRESNGQQTLNVESQNVARSPSNYLNKAKNIHDVLVMKRVNPMDQFANNSELYQDLQQKALKTDPLSSPRSCVSNALFVSNQQRNPYKKKSQKTKMITSKQSNSPECRNQNRKQEDIKQNQKCSFNTNQAMEVVNEEVSNEQKFTVVHSVTKQASQKETDAQGNVDFGVQTVGFNSLMPSLDVKISPICIKTNEYITSNKVPDNAQIKIQTIDDFLKNMTQHKGNVSTLIDEIYKKERTYIGNYDKDNILTIRSPIFELQKYHNLKTQTGVEQPLYQQAVKDQKIESLRLQHFSISKGTQMTPLMNQQQQDLKSYASAVDNKKDSTEECAVQLVANCVPAEQQNDKLNCLSTDTANICENTLSNNGSQFKMLR